MAIRITVDLRELETLTVHLDRAVRMSTEGLVAELGDRTLKQTARRFDARQAPDGSPWPPRKDSKPHPLLEETGRLRRSIQLRAPQEREALIGTAGVPYAATQHFGSERRGIPARTFLGFAGEDLAELADTSERWMARFVGERL